MRLRVFLLIYEYFKMTEKTKVRVLKRRKARTFSRSTFSFGPTAETKELRLLNLNQSTSFKDKVINALPLIKLLVLTALPLFALMYVSFANLCLMKDQINAKEKIKEDLHNMAVLHEAIEALQIERGAQCIHSSSKGNNFMQKILNASIETSDQKLKRASSFITNKYKNSPRSCDDRLTTDLHRHRRNSPEYCLDNMEFYDKRIDCFYSSLVNLSRNSDEGHFWIDLYARTMLWFGYNSLRKKQSLGSVIYGNTGHRDMLRKEFKATSCKANSIIRGVIKVLPKLEELLEEHIIEKADVMEHILNMENELLNSSSDIHIDGQQMWFGNFTELMSVFQITDVNLTNHVNNELKRAIAELKKRLLHEIGLLTIIVLCSGSLSIIHGIKQQIITNKIRDFTAKLASKSEQIAKEKKRTEQLLSQMLPESVTGRLLQGLKVEPESYNEATIFFSDVVGFTRLCSTSTPFEIIDFLNQLYMIFDEILDGYDCYKVETIGDGYMVVSGLPDRNKRRHSDEICTLALEVMMEIKDFVISHIPEERVRMRIGIHTGPCAAGIVGVKMPRYCLFGDAVNTAARMESNGLPDKIQISSQTRFHLSSYHAGFHYVQRGAMSVKGKGNMTTYWLLGKTGFPFEINIGQNDVEGDTSSRYKGDEETDDKRKESV